ncbi:MAG TPA: tRNA (guanosine(37)-N1)-methyltransferase TrmD [Gammaproteobacteria bacterium]|nr:tRNA (guanosine(37)-N1)-methyltransferase TrmD [Gammaproteobacteria bacterium]
MRIDVVTLFPEMVETIGRYGVTGRAVERGLLQLACWNPRDYSQDAYRAVDDRPFGGGPGMVMMVQPLRDAIQAARQAAAAPDTRVIYLSPQGRRLDHGLACRMARQYSSLVLVAGRYEGIDERLLEAEIDEELSIGDYVLSGGELAAMVVIDALARQLPGVLGHGESSQQDTFSQGLLEHAQYTRPREIDGRRVPEVLLSGDHAAIERWREKQALGRTWLKRPDLLEGMSLSEEQLRLLEEFKQEQNNRE